MQKNEGHTAKENKSQDRFFKRLPDSFVRITQSMERSRSTLLIIGIVFVFVLVGINVVVFVMVRGGGWARQRRAPTTQPRNHATTQPSRLLDGVNVEYASTTAMAPYAVMVENSMDAWPLSGPAKANVVFEAPVEGSITRFMLMFDPSATTTEIGPVRSARPYFVEWANAYGAMYAHVGGSPDALNLIRRLDGFQDLNQFWHGNDFWRSSSHYAPHNVFTSMDRLASAASKQGVSTTTFQAWSYEDRVRSPQTTVRETTSTDIIVPYQGAYEAEWEYVSSTGLYERSQNNHLERDADGATVEVKNVVVMLVDSSVLDAVGRLEIQTTGSGKALLFRDGTVQTGTWSREKGKTIRFETGDGHDMLFAPGKTWISAVDDAAGFDKIIDKSTSQ